jgi:predicted outer membrane repeat protein
MIQKNSIIESNLDMKQSNFAIKTDTSELEVRDSIFRETEGFHIENSYTYFFNCTFNHSGKFPSILSISSNLTVENSKFFKVHGESNAIQILNFENFAYVKNSSFHNFRGAEEGGAIKIEGMEGIVGEKTLENKIINCTFWNNSASQGGALFVMSNIDMFQIILEDNTFSGNRAIRSDN